MTIDKIHSRILLVLDQEISGYNTPPEIDRALDMASMWCFNEYASLYAVNQTAREALAPFIYSLDFVTDALGVFDVVNSLPTDEFFIKLLTMDVVVNDTTAPSYVAGQNRYYAVDFIGDDEFASRMNSQLNPPSAKSPLGLVNGKGLYKLYPLQVHAGKMRFLRKPAAPVFGFSESGRVITYDAVTSTQLEWNNLFINRVIARALSILGVNLSDEKLAQYGLLWPKEGI
jgi:hypothetical protein